MEGTCHCGDVCPNYVREGALALNTGWEIDKRCPELEVWRAFHRGYCVCNFFGCKNVTVVKISRAPAVGVTVVVKNLEEHWGLMKKQVHSPASVRDGWRTTRRKKTPVPISISLHPLSADGKRNLLADKYCNDEQVVREDIYEVLLAFALSKYEGVVLSEVELAGGIDKVLTCDLFNKSYGDVSHLTLCDNKHLMKKGKKQKKTP